MKLLNILPGLVMCIIIGGISFIVARYIPLGSVTISILLGVLTANIVRLPDITKEGVRFAEKKILTWAIALLGLELDYRVLLSLGYSTIVIILAGVIFTIGMGLFWGKILKAGRNLSLLVGIGNAVCGSSAIAAAQGVIKAEEEDVGVSIAVINLLGTVGIFLLPGIFFMWTGFPNAGKGILIGDTLQAVGQVTAAGFSLSDAIGQTATIVKMGRILLLTPLVLILGGIRKRKTGEDIRGEKLPGIPLYILFFILFSVIGSVEMLPALATAAIKLISKLLLTVAMAGIGMKITLHQLIRGGRTALGIGMLTWGCQIAFSLLLIMLLQ
jgi:uncharacterized integral membrane protein (TIGR00698 family)